MNKEFIINYLKSNEVKEILQSLGIIHLYLVGSYSRGDYKENSDIDLVYEKDKNKRIGGIEFMKNKTILEEKLNKKIDLVNYNYIYNDIKPFIEKDKILIY